ncbi:hypothetical protein EYF80_047202 [Liparis tanakae]|uniref:Uncharacterized protein n=1 Tax=Liparis tanakae TaxID=230148 RepID=A0A4Z2FNY8_9TELE|nr:hypothetical protein EYF80_047202 [Liparis tanakae]
MDRKWRIIPVYSLCIFSILVVFIHVVFILGVVLLFFLLLVVFILGVVLLFLLLFFLLLLVVVGFLIDPLNDNRDDLTHGLHCRFKTKSNPQVTFSIFTLEPQDGHLWLNSWRRRLSFTTDGTAAGFNVSWSVRLPPGWVSVRRSRQALLKCSLQMVMSVHDDSLNRCLLTAARNWTHSSLLSGSSGNLNRCAPRRSDSHPATEHMLRVGLLTGLRPPARTLFKRRTVGGLTFDVHHRAELR